MSDRPNVSEELSPVKRALHEIHALRARVAQLETASRAANCSEPIAIVGAGLRFPGGAVDEESFWNLLANGTDAITEIPLDRWNWRAYFDANPDAAGTMYTRHGGFLDGVDGFDAAFFGISPREAAAMDPQHRLTLEVAWEALENSGHSPASLQESAAGIFLGIANNDYGRAALADIENVDAYTGSGNSPSMVAGRLSYVLGLHGPSLAIDTSCSSSLAAVHLACQSLRAGECRVALAGGVNLILSPESNIALSKAHMMAPDGRCKTFDASADGYVRSEGCCMVVLKKLADAEAEGDRILAVIRGSAMNHDGRSGGLTAPSGPAQAAVIEQALRISGIKADEIGYVETHGTGTSLGDPIEVETLGVVFGKGRSAEKPLFIGAIKTNIGHAEAASGIAGLMKTVLALQHRAIPPSLHLHRKNPHIRWERLPIAVPTELTKWKPEHGRLYAGVSSFGFSGTNVHVVLEEAPLQDQAKNSDLWRAQILAISARSETALENLRAKYAAVLRLCPPEELDDFCFTANAGRMHLNHRIAVVGNNAEEMADALERFPDPGDSDFPKLFAGEVDPSLENEEAGRNCETPEDLAQLYIEGRKIDWSSIYKGQRRRRIPLPTYPFERRRYWLADNAADSAKRAWLASSSAALAQSRMVPIGLRLASFPEKWECLERLTIAEILDTLHEFGAFARPETSHDANSLAAECGIAPGQVKLLETWLNVLARAGYLENSGARFINRAALPTGDTAGIWREVETLLEDDPFLLEYLRNCSKHLAGVMRGTTSPLETLFPSGSPNLARNLYEKSGGAQYVNMIVAAAVQAACAAGPTNRRLRIMELGGGTGATTSAVLPKLPAHRVTYRFTDISDVFLQQASARFADFPFVQYGVLDIEDRERMAGHAGFFDVVIAANVVHATRDIGTTLSSIAGLLAPGGMVVLLEATREMAWREITIALMEGWQKPDDAIRGTNVLMGVEEWKSALLQAGFEEAAAVPEAGSPAESIGLHVILGRRNFARTQAAADGLTMGEGFVPASGAVTISASSDMALAQLRAATLSERHGILLTTVCEEIAYILRLPPENMPARHDRLMDLGMDSLMAVELRNRLAARLELENISATLIFDYPTPDAIADHLLELMDDGSSRDAESESKWEPPSNGHLLTEEEVADMPEEEIAALLRARLTR